jgi:hypothetical protein
MTYKVDMTEKEFKKLKHRFDHYHSLSFGSEVCEGYRPDLTLLNCRNQLAFIIEVETTPSRKTVVGDLTKAEKYCEDTERSAILLIVLEERSNTTKRQIALHLKPYLDWLKKKRTRKVGVSEVLVITDKDYKTSVSCKEAFGSRQFLKRCMVVSSRSGAPCS